MIRKMVVDFGTIIPSDGWAHAHYTISTQHLRGPTGTSGVRSAWREEYKE